MGVPLAVANVYAGLESAFIDLRSSTALSALAVPSVLVGILPG
jgi:hypothetical protein